MRDDYPFSRLLLSQGWSRCILFSSLRRGREDKLLGKGS